MSEIDIRVEEDDSIIKIFGENRGEIERELRDAVDDISDRIEEYAKILAPEGETGELKEHPVDVQKIFGSVEGRAATFGGGYSIRGPSGRFIGVGVIPGRVVSHIEISVAKEPAHAIWVHQGTGVFGPHGTPIVSPHGNLMVFEINGRKFRRRSVLGQPPQPYLTEAYEFVNRTFVDKRVEQLRLEVANSFR